MTRLLTLQQIHEASGLAVKTLYAMCAAGELAVVRTQTGPGKQQRTRGAIRVTEADWDAWVERHRTPAKQEGRAAVAPRVPAHLAAIDGGRRSVLQLRGADKFANG